MNTARQIGTALGAAAVIALIGDGKSGSGAAGGMGSAGGIGAADPALFFSVWLCAGIAAAGAWGCARMLRRRNAAVHP